MLCVLSPRAFALFPKTDNDMRQLPPFCQARMSQQETPEKAKWKKRLGTDFSHIHHLCAGIFTYKYAINTATLTASQREFHLRKAIGETSYLIKHARKDFVLMPLVYTTQAKAFIGLKEYNEAIAHLNKAIDANPKYISPYIILSDLYFNQGNFQEAANALERGLAVKPDSTHLKVRYKKALEARKLEGEVAKQPSDAGEPGQTGGETSLSDGATPDKAVTTEEKAE